MMNPIGICNEDRVGSRGPWFGDRTTATSVLERWSGSGRYEGSGVGMAGMAERYWKELRPSSAGRFPLDVAIRRDRERTNATRAAPVGPSEPGSAPPPGRAHRISNPTALPVPGTQAPLPAPRGEGGGRGQQVARVGGEGGSRFQHRAAHAAGGVSRLCGSRGAPI